jgi:hypothetical protein
MRVRRLLPAAALVLAACGDAVVPDENAGVYRLESINGAHMPAAMPNGPFGGQFIARGDLLVLPDGHFELQIASMFPSLVTGTAHVSDGSVTLVWQFEGDTTHYRATGTAGGDSLALTVINGAHVTQVFRRFARRRPAIGDGTYVLATINGDPVPAAISDDTSGGIRYVHRVVYDTIMLRNGLFFSRSRKETQAAYNPAGDSAVGSNAFTTFGTFISVGTRVILSDAWLGHSNDPLSDPTQVVRDTFTTSSAGFSTTAVVPALFTAIYTKR